MRKFMALLAVAGVIAVSAPAQAAPTAVHGSFVQAFQKPHQPHRFYFQVTAGQGSKDCQVTEVHKTLGVSLGTDKLSPLTYIWYVKPANAAKATAAAKAAPSPTSAIVCTH